jgi:hypothetical protein
VCQTEELLHDEIGGAELEKLEPSSPTQALHGPSVAPCGHK